MSPRYHGTDVPYFWSHRFGCDICVVMVTFKMDFGGQWTSHDERRIVREHHVKECGHGRRGEV